MGGWVGGPAVKGGWAGGIERGEGPSPPPLPPPRRRPVTRALLFFPALSLSLTSRVGTAGATDTSKRLMLGNSWSPVGGAGEGAGIVGGAGRVWGGGGGARGGQGRGRGARRAKKSGSEGGAATPRRAHSFLFFLCSDHPPPRRALHPPHTAAPHTPGQSGSASLQRGWREVGAGPAVGGGQARPPAACRGAAAAARRLARSLRPRAGAAGAASSPLHPGRSVACMSRAVTDPAGGVGREAAGRGGRGQGREGRRPSARPPAPALPDAERPSSSSSFFGGSARAAPSPPHGEEGREACAAFHTHSLLLTPFSSPPHTHGRQHPTKRKRPPPTPLHTRPVERGRPHTHTKHTHAPTPSP